MSASLTLEDGLVLKYDVHVLMQRRKKAVNKCGCC